MIARIWKGRTHIDNAGDYTVFLKQRAIPDYSNTEGFQGLSFLRQMNNDECHFTLITFWKNWESIKSFAGEDHEKAKYYAEDDQFLLDFNEFVEHHEVFHDFRPFP
jgi:heme-degrading monooxygenase HmoA